MPFDLAQTLVVGVASSALFDLGESDGVFTSQGEEAYREYQREKRDDPFDPGVAFPFIKRLLSFNDLGGPDEPPVVEVIVLSRNDPQTGLRAMNSISHHGLPITRAIFTQGQAPHAYIPALNIKLFLSANAGDVLTATQAGFPAGAVRGTPAKDPTGQELRVSFDFDGVLADDSSERIMQAEGLDAFHAHETEHVDEPIGQGQMAPLLAALNRVQELEADRMAQDPSYERRLRISIVTARNAPSHERVIRTLEDWGLRVNDAFFLGGLEKGAILKVLSPHLFFDDQERHLVSAADSIACVHIPFGVVNDSTSD